MTKRRGLSGIRMAGLFAAVTLTVSVRKFLSDRCPSWAAALAYTTLLALVPITVLSFSIFSTFSSSASYEEQVRSLLFAHFLPTSGELVYNYVRTFARNAGALSFLGLVVLIPTAFSLVTLLENTFSRIWGISRSRTLIERFVTFWTALTVVPFLIGFSLYLSSWLGPLPYPSWLYRLAKVLVPLLTTWAAFFVVYLFLPKSEVHWTSALSGALLAGTLWEGAKLSFDSYVRHFSNFTQVYGSLAMIPLFLFWLYLTWLLVLYGAEVTHLVQVPQAVPATREHSPGSPAFYGLLGLLAISQAYRRGESPLTLQRIASKVGVEPSSMAAALAQFEGAGILMKTIGAGEQSYLLTRAPETIFLMEALVAIRGEAGSASKEGNEPLARYLQGLLGRLREKEQKAWGHLTLGEASREADEFIVSETLSNRPLDGSDESEAPSREECSHEG
ncbi:MAG: YhjD/YihY/BrkB family envelope integrity protein [Nitrospinota bacterium]